MSHARLTHSTRPTLEFRQGQRDNDVREAVSNIANNLGTKDPPIVVIETRRRTRTIDGLVSAPRRAAADSDTNDWVQALANYIDRLEAHLDEYQGEGYTLEDDRRDDTQPVVYNSLEWSYAPGAPYEVEFTIECQTGEGVLETERIDRRNPTVDTGMDVIARVGGEDLPGFRQFTSNRQVGMDPVAIYDTETADNNDVVVNEGPQQTWTVEGTLTGSLSQRQAKDDALQALIGSQVTLETRFPGYHIDGYVLGYDSTLETRFGGNSGHYTLEFQEGVPA